MKAGKLDRTIIIQRATTTVDDAGVAHNDWSDLATVRAQLLQTSTTEFIRNYGEGADTVVVFRIRYLDGITTGDRVVYEGENFNIVETKEIGRRQGLELRATTGSAT